jgi:hypothetical protein
MPQTRVFILMEDTGYVKYSLFIRVGANDAINIECADNVHCVSRRPGHDASSSFVSYLIAHERQAFGPSPIQHNPSVSNLIPS